MIHPWTPVLVKGRMRCSWPKAGPGLLWSAKGWQRPRSSGCNGPQSSGSNTRLQTRAAGHTEAAQRGRRAPLALCCSHGPLRPAGPHTRAHTAPPETRPLLLTCSHAPLTHLPRPAHTHFQRPCLVPGPSSCPRPLLKQLALEMPRC